MLPKGLLRCMVSSQKRWLSGRCEALFGPCGPGVARVLPMPLTSVDGLDAYASALVGLKGESLLLLRDGWNDWVIGGAVSIPRIGLLGNPRGIQIGVTRRTGYLKGGAETPGCMRSWLLGGQGSTEPRCQ